MPRILAAAYLLVLNSSTSILATVALIEGIIDLAAYSQGSSALECVVDLLGVSNHLGYNMAIRF
ncbi:MAG: hypothetical protein GSR85_02205 [Desulfurococcales archaeon]|nr:hypothetical protein [Desulfurococcales archaeon]